MSSRVPIVMVMVLALALGPGAGLAQGQAMVTASEVETLKRELQRLQERLNRLEFGSPPVAQAAPPAPPARPPAGEREITLERGHPLETLGLPRPEIAGARISGFFVGSANYNTHTQMVPEFAGNPNVTSEPRSVDFKFDQFSIVNF